MDEVDTESATDAAAEASAILLRMHLSGASIYARVEKALNCLSTPSGKPERSCEVSSASEGHEIIFSAGERHAISLGKGRLEPEKLGLSLVFHS